MTGHNSEVIILNVGGRTWQTTAATLTSVPHSRFDEILRAHAHKHGHNSTTEPFFIDRDGDLFEHILAYLRDPHSTIVGKRLVALPELTKMGVQAEAEYYKLTDLVHLLGTGVAAVGSQGRMWSGCPISGP